MQKDENAATPANELTDEDKAIVADQEENHDEDEEGEAGDESAATVAPADVQDTLVTKEGLKKLKDDLLHLENVRRKEVAGRLKEAISYGDLSENSEYEDAKNEQAFVEGRIIELSQMIKYAKIIAEKSSGASTKTIKIGSTVTIQNITEKGDPEIYTIVGSTETDPRESKISNESPIGAAVIDKEKGDEVEVIAPAGIFKYKIVKVA